MILQVDDLVQKRVHGKVTREVLDNVFGPALLATLGTYGKRPGRDAEGGLTRNYRERDQGGDGEEKLDELGANGKADELQVTDTHLLSRDCATLVVCLICLVDGVMVVSRFQVSRSNHRFCSEMVLDT